MKTRFNTFDIACGVTELQKLVGMRVNQIYDVDNKTYLIRFQANEQKSMLLLESGIRFHTTAFEWPKNVAPSGFSMKLRKHLKNKRLEKLEQLGADRIVDFQFGTGEAAYHVILELYDKGNIILTDNELTILYILRPHIEGEVMRFMVREKYPVNRAKPQTESKSEDIAQQIIDQLSSGGNLRRVLMSVLDCGPAAIDHVLKRHNLENRITKCNENESTDANNEKLTGKNSKYKDKNKNGELFNYDKDFPALIEAIKEANNLLLECRKSTSNGYIIQSQEEKPSENETIEYFYRNIEYHPMLFDQFIGQPFAKFDTFMLAVDEFYSNLESQKIDVKTLHQEREALKKLTNVRKDHAKRLEDLTKTQELDKRKAERITCNQVLVDNAILAVRSAIANQLSWPDIHELVKGAQANGDPVAKSIKQLKLEINHISLSLKDPYESDEVEDGDELTVDIDLALTAWANARRYYDQKRQAAQKEQKTIDASQKALKSAEKKTQQTLKNARTISTITKARKVYWFEKFYWFISSENYLVIGGRDAQQNELIVKRYMRPTDIYVHAEIQGASSVVIRNTKEDIPPKTLLEAGTMAISYSVAWDAKVVTNAYWVHSHQVSKTAPTGEYLGTGSFMIRGKKNFLPSCHLIMGMSVLFKLEDSFVSKHLGERKVRTIDEDSQEQYGHDLVESQFYKEILDDINESSDDESDKMKVEKNEAPLQLDNSENASASAFPDTEVKIEHDTGRITIRADSISDDENTAPVNILEKDQPISNIEETTIIAAAPSRKKQQQNSKTKKKDDNARKAKAAEIVKNQQNTSDTNKNSPIKRGQKGKLKKMKSKYKDQDDEERELRMMILNSSGVAKTIESNIKPQAQEPRINQEPKSEKIKQPQLQYEVDDGDDIPLNADIDILDTLTGQPFDDDELIFAIPVVAPYQALQQYKYKIKLTPGTGKRGRAAKTALAIFSKDKSCNTRDKNLLNSVKEEALARNIPGKVKLSAPQMQKVKK